MRNSSNPQALINLIYRLWRHFSLKQKKQIVLLLLLMVLASLSEALSIGAVIPFLAVAQWRQTLELKEIFCPLGPGALIRPAGDWEKPFSFSGPPTFLWSRPKSTSFIAVCFDQNPPSVPHPKINNTVLAFLLSPQLGARESS
jgi:hypothetical protein